MTALPFLKLYPRDWRGDEALQSVGLYARGLWFEMCLLMHGMEPYGHLVRKGAPMTPETLARVLHEPLADIDRALAELEDAGVFSRLDDGTITSRRMIRDAQKRMEAAEYGALGGNPKLVNGGDKGAHIGKDKPTRPSRARVRRCALPSEPLISGPLNSDALRVVGTDAGTGDPGSTVEAKVDVSGVLREPEFATLAAHPAFAAFWSEWLAHRCETRRPYKPRGAREALRRALDVGPDCWIAAAKTSMANGWQGVFPERLMNRPAAGPDKLQRYALDLLDGLQQREASA